MLSSSLAVATLLNLVGNANSLAIPNVSSTQYHYVPVDFDYGSDSRVTANFTFGTAPDPEPIKIVMDTGSDNFWIWQPNATINYGSPYLGFTGPCNQSVAAEYDPSKSVTATLSNHSSAYAYAGNSKIVSGVQYANDTLTAIGGDGPIPNVEVALENFGLFRQLDDGSCRGITFDKGILGLAPFTNTTTGPSFRQNLYDAGALASKTMFMWFNKATTDFTRMTGGTLFGAIDTSKFTGPLVRVPQVVGASQVGLYVPRPLITFNGKTYNTSDTETCLVDAGSHADALPFPYTSNESTIFYAQSGGQLMDWNGVVAFNGTCDTIPKDLTIGYTFPGVDTTQSIKIDVPIRNYARGALTQNVTLDATICLLNLEMGGCLFAAPFSTAAFVALDDEDNSIAFAQGGVSEEGEGVDVASLKVIGPGQSWDTV